MAEKRLARICILLEILIIPFLLIPLLASAQESGTISGSVINLTGEERPVANQEVTLKVSEGESEVKSLTTTTDESGHFTFDNLATEPKYSYVLSTTYQNGEYNSDSLTFAESQKSITYDIQVYDATEDDVKISIALEHVLLEFREGKILVSQFFSLVNPTRLTYVGELDPSTDKRKTLKFSVPKGVTNLQYGGDLMACCVTFSEGVVQDSMDFKPGEKQAVLSYELNPGASTYKFVGTADYDVTELDVLLLDTGIQVSSDKLGFLGREEFEGNKYIVFSASSLKKGDRFDIKLSNLESGRVNLVGIVSGTMVFLAAAVLIYYLWQIRRPAGVKVSASTAAEPVKTKAQPKEDKGKLIKDLQDRKKALIQIIATLDDQYERGEIDEKVYQEMRQEQKEKLIAVAERLERETSKKRVESEEGHHGEI